MTRKFDRQTNGEMELYSRDYGSGIGWELAPCVQVLISTTVRLAQTWVGQVATHYNTEPNSVGMQMTTVVSVNQLSMYRAVLVCYFGRRGESGNVSPETNLNISDDKVTNFTRHEPRFVWSCFDISTAFRIQQKQFSSVHFKRRWQVSREAGFSKLVEGRQCFVTRPVILFIKEGITTTRCECCALRDDSAAEAKGVLGDNTIFGPIQDHFTLWTALHRSAVCSLSNNGSRSWVVISRGVDRHYGSFGRCKQSINPETVVPQNEISSSDGLRIWL